MSAKRFTINPPAGSSRALSTSAKSSSSSTSPFPLPPPSETVLPEAIFVDSDDDMEEVPVFKGESSMRIAETGHQKQQNTDGSGCLAMPTAGVEDREAIKVALASLDTEIKSVATQLQPLQELHAALSAERRVLESRLTSLASLAISKSTSFPTPRSSSKSVDYQSSSFPWSSAVNPLAKSVFDIKSFRLCQEGVINAALDDRDIVCVMPTGGGKSLTYQLPAVFGSNGLTVVISPLLALIWDQVRGLKERGVECVMMTGGTSREEQNDIYRRLEVGTGSGREEIRLCYVTPEKISKSKRLMSVFEKVNSAGRLKRFVIDEAHCCSQLGHDFRPDYKKLSVLKTLFPRVPIQAVTATLSRKTMPDLLKILRLAPICDGRAADTRGTVFFSAPLFRPNLRYQVMTKPSNAKTAIEAVGKWITEYHLNDSGIIYCLSKKDAETVAEQLKSWSNGAVKTGVYHADVGDWEKERIHVDWRKGKVNVICATIAFGLGIDKGDVRYVIHHSMSKSLEGYYQETGRAGRDGQDSDCVLFYRGQDASRLSSLTYGDVDGKSKLQEMMRFAQDLTSCRKVAFANYFSQSDHLSTAAWDHADALAPESADGMKVSECGICDNCVRDPASIITRNATLESWRILKIAQAIELDSGRVTLANLADLVRGLGGGSFGVNEGKKRRKGDDSKGKVDIVDVAGGKVSLNKEDTEILLIHLTLLGYLEESYSATAYAVNVYLIATPKAVRLTRLSETDIESGSFTSKIECTFPNPKAKAVPEKRASKKAKQVSKEADDDGQDVKSEREDLRDLNEWDIGENDSGEERENGWKVHKSTGGGRKRAITVSDDECGHDARVGSKSSHGGFPAVALGSC